MSDEAIPAVTDTQNVAPVTTDPAAMDDSGSGSTGELTMKSSFKSLGELREVAPKIYNKFMEGIAQSMIDDMKRGQERVKEAMRKIREE